MMGFLKFKSKVQKMQDKRDVPGLVKALADADADTRQTALRALFQLGLAADMLKTAHAQRAWPVWHRVVQQVLNMPDRRVIDPLLIVLADPACRTYPDVADAAVRTLDRLGWRPFRPEEAPALYHEIRRLRGGQKQEE